VVSFLDSEGTWMLGVGAFFVGSAWMTEGLYWYSYRRLFDTISGRGAGFGLGFFCLYHI
jgi:hypothetical protein